MARCETKNINIGQIINDRRLINPDPPYQREGNVWSKDKKQLLIDSIVNQFDIPKFYFHHIPGKDKDGFLDAIIDGKQRFETILAFVDGDVSLPKGFKYDGENENVKKFFDNNNQRAITYSDFDDSSRRVFDSFQLSVCSVILDGDEEFLEDMFRRLNDGESINAAEYRNSIQGDMTDLIRELEKHKFVDKKLAFKFKRFNQRELVTKFLQFEEFNRAGSSNFYCDVKKKNLDDLVFNNKALSAPVKKQLETRVTKHLNIMNKIFDDNDPLLRKASLPQVYYVFCREILSKYGHNDIHKFLKNFLKDFEKARVVNNQRDETDTNIDWKLVAYTQLCSGGTGNVQNLEERCKIKIEKFLERYPEVNRLDTKRSFSREEKYALYTLTDPKECYVCKTPISLDDATVDHLTPHSKGGQTIFKNLKICCVSCNSSKGANII